jgi:tRNA-Thr(GGU) m(6)t(6)A37 methyltransferase TsaA
MKELKFIGIIHSRYKRLSDAPRQGGNEVCNIEIFKKYEEGLIDIEGFSHLHVFYWLHKAHGFTLSVNTPWDDKSHGLFATRSPHRINPIAYAAVELLERKQNILKVKGLDAIEGTPVLDIKPYIHIIDAKPEARTGWLLKKDFLKPRIYEYETSAEWTEGKKAICRSQNKPDIAVGCPSEFGGSKESWSPEHLFVAAIDVCIMTTFLWLIEKNDLGIVSYTSEAKGRAHILKGDFVFTEVEIGPVIEIKNKENENRINDLIIEAGNQCMVSKSSKCKFLLHPLIKALK